MGKSLYGCHGATKPAAGGSAVSLGGLFRSVPGVGACHLGATRSSAWALPRVWASDEDGDEDGAGADARRSKDATRGSQGCGCAKREVESPPRSIGPRGEGAVAKVARPFRGLSVTQTSRLPLQQTKAKNCAAKLCCQVSAARRRHPR